MSIRNPNRALEPFPDQGVRIPSRNRTHLRISPSFERLLHLGFLVSITYAVLILGITFRNANPLDPVLHPLAVTVVDTRSIHPPQDIHVYAQVNSRGGTHHPERAIEASRLPSGQLDQNGLRNAHDARRSQQHRHVYRANPERGAGFQTGNHQAMVSRARSTRQVSLRSRADTRYLAPLEIEHLMVASRSSLPPVTQSRRPDVGSDAVDPKPWPAVSARALTLARYLSAWRKRIEQVGDQLLHRHGMDPALRGYLLLAVTLRADGSISALHFVREARNAQLDRLALETIRGAQPFPPLPRTRTGRQSFRFIYEWRFFNHHATAGAIPFHRAHS